MSDAGDGNEWSQEELVQIERARDTIRRKLPRWRIVGDALIPGTGSVYRTVSAAHRELREHYRASRSGSQAPPLGFSTPIFAFRVEFVDNAAISAKTVIVSPHDDALIGWET